MELKSHPLRPALDQRELPALFGARGRGRAFWCASANGRLLPLFLLLLLLLLCHGLRRHVETLAAAAQTVRGAQAQLRRGARRSTDWYWKTAALMRLRASTGAGPADPAMTAAALIGKRLVDPASLTLTSLSATQFKAICAADQGLRDIRARIDSDSDRPGYISVSGTPRFGNLARIMLIAMAIYANAAASAIMVVDDAGNSVRLPNPAQRIISLSPGTTELLFAAGAGMKVVGSVAPSDYPAAAASIAVVGGSSSIDPERIATLAPDLIVAWPYGAAQRQMAQLRSLGVPVFVSDPRSLADIASSLEAFGRLADTHRVAAAAAASFRQRIEVLRRTHADALPLRVFLQIWGQPLMTVNDRHPIADVLRLCGGRNIFATSYPLAPTVGFEAVVAANPQAIVAIASRKPAADWLAAWRRWPGIAAVRANATFAIEPDLITRPTPRIVEGADLLCKNLQLIRERLATAP